MPAKIYLEAPPNGDFRAMPARGQGFALLKWVTSFPGNSERGLPVVTGALLLSSADTGELLAIIDCAAVTSLRTGAGAALSAQVLAADGARSVGIGYGPGVCADLRAEAAAALAGELGWAVGERSEAAKQDIVVSVTPGGQPVIMASDLRPGQHLAALGADAAGKAEVELAAVRRCRLYCDERDQAARGGELANGIKEGVLSADQLTQLGDVLIGRAGGRASSEEITLFDSTGLATQDLAIALSVYEAWRRGEVQAQDVTL
jgi:ornithine cyclodeaminase/alanine dehydrogenase-like protein (mu-crystallin family)